jgi:crotonobetainyl-CoA:carnitine CoA-transferase CaiB-like acyl-CoA transferase
MKIMEGIRVVELASWVFVPSAGAILSDWGAEVVKIEHPVTGDPCRGLNASALPTNAPNIMLEMANRGKRSVGLDVTHDRGREVLRRLVERADVFLTSWLGAALRKYHLDVDDVREWNPRIVYARGTGMGPKGPEADRPGFDATTYWFRAGFADSLTPDDQEWPISQRLGIGDIPSGAILAGGVAGALLARERTGTSPLVDVSLFSSAAWTLSPDIASGWLNPGTRRALIGRGDAKNPLANMYRTKDDRVLSLVMMDSDRYWDDFCRHLDLEHLIDDPRFSDSGRRRTTALELITILDGVFGGRTVDEWRPVLSTMKGAWTVVQTAAELARDPQFVANDFFTAVVERPGDVDLRLPQPPVRYDETPVELHRMPEHAEHTEEVLLELGYAWDDVAAMKDAGTVS